MGASESTAAAVVAEGHGQGPGVAPPPSAQRRTSFSDGSAPGAALDHIDSSELVSSVLTDAGGELSPHQQRVQRIMGDKYPPLAWAPGARAPAPAPDASALHARALAPAPSLRCDSSSGSSCRGVPHYSGGAPRSAVLDPTTTATPPGPAAAASIQPASRDGGRSGSGTSTLSASGSINGARPAPVMVPAAAASAATTAAAAATATWRASLPAHSRVTPLGPVSHQAVSAQRCSAKSLSRLYSLPSLDNLPSPPPHASAHAHQAPPAPAPSASSHASPAGAPSVSATATPATAAAVAPPAAIHPHAPPAALLSCASCASCGSIGHGSRCGALSPSLPSSEGGGGARRAAQQALLARESIERRARMSAHKEQVLRLEAEEAAAAARAKADADAARAAKLKAAREHERSRMRQKVQERERSKAIRLMRLLERALQLEARQSKAAVQLQAGARRMLARREVRRRHGDAIQRQLTAFQAAWAARASSSVEPEEIA